MFSETRVKFFRSDTQNLSHICMFGFSPTFTEAGTHWKLASTPLNLTSCTRGCSSDSLHKSLHSKIGRILAQSCPHTWPPHHMAKNSTNFHMARNLRNLAKTSAAEDVGTPISQLEMWPILPRNHLSDTKQHRHQAIHFRTYLENSKPQ